MQLKLRRISDRSIKAVAYLGKGKNLIRAALLSVGLFVFSLTAWPALAAVELVDFLGVSGPDSLVLQWVTLREINLARWDIYCKDEIQPAAAFHLIGSTEALGGPSQGYAYDFDVPALTPGISYCFRLDEITVDGSSGESYDVCGLGYGVTPTPTPPEEEGAGVVADRSYGPGTPIPGAEAIVPQNEGGGPATSTPTATPVSNSPVATPTSYTQSPLASPIADGQADPAAVAQSSGSSAVAEVGPATDPVSVDQPTPLPTTTPDPGYIVVTATPTSEAVAQLSPTFTPLPTATPQSEVLLAQLADLDAETLVLAALCFVFFGATGIGVLGITSLGLYFRSRSNNRRR